MKKIFKTMMLSLLFMISMISCNNEELFVEPVEEVVDEVPTDPEDENNEGGEVDATLPCDFTLDNVEPNSTIIINCILDLGGGTVSLPENVTIVYEGGDIINGTLNFEKGSVIAGELLNTTLTINGAIPQLKDPTFHFDAKRWGIVEGVVSDEIAAANRDIINEIINLVIDLGGSTVNLDNIDAYFNVSGEDIDDVSIIIPSNFHFKMGDNCNLRVQPNGYNGSALIRSRSTDNVMISGGKLWGDRYTHDYNATSGTHEWGHVMSLKGVQNSVVDGVEMHEGAGDGLKIAGDQHRYNDGSIKPNGRESRNLTIKNCLINDNRRNNISLTDGTEIYIEYNTITNSGSGDDSPGTSSNGTSPRAGIDVEAFKNNAPDDNSVYDWEKTEDIHIRNNIFEDNYAVDIALYNGEKTYVYENTFRSQRGVGTSYGFNNKIYNNTFERPEGLMSGSSAITLEPKYWANGNHRIIDFQIYDNYFKGYQFAIVAGGQGHTFKNNTMTNCQRGIILITSEDLEFDNNIISSSIEDSYGYYTFSGENSVKNCLIKNGEISVQKRDLFFANVNNDSAGGITIDNIDFNAGGVFLNSAQYITISNSTFTDLKIVDCNPTLVNNNN
ncbi:right-handed parallel beta-helix repeat-containing protein [Tamlana sp. 2201CG12-4]|uniref:right-handed parallel beta-helix repeat-containing protein n=1 Tax=Tamlana sp. 2201CG12-4 TaxID=3112582 RepID=UPI002DBA77D9|nr:right-handed parallel beta-helix repeat-containing protein [Tamlana sp. 2201CG12-4]MEC3908035.1 right-handed parallel beta-helix repeat-containing protein [Tamlana sp. 2201CG12-4]